MPSTISVGPISSRRDDEPRTSPTKSMRRSRSSAGVGTRPPARSWFELLDEPVERPRIVEQARDVGAARPAARSERAEGGAQVAQQRRERPMRVGKQPTRHGEPAALERDRKPARRARRSRHGGAGAGGAQRVAQGLHLRGMRGGSTTDSTGVDRAASMTAGTRTAAASAGVKAPCSIPSSATAIRRSWSGSAKPSAARTAASSVRWIGDAVVADGHGVDDIGAPIGRRRRSRPPCRGRSVPARRPRARRRRRRAA